MRSILLMLVLAGSVAGIQTIAQPTNPCMATSGIYPRPEPKYDGKMERNFSIFDKALLRNEQVQTEAFHGLVHRKTIAQLQTLMQAKKLSSEELLLYYVHRVKTYDEQLLNSIIELNPDALAIARQMDAERKKGKLRGAMHGIPILLKDNIATADKMHTSAGTAALNSWKPSADAALVAQLRKGGAIIFGKANMSEWANWMDPCMPSGFSTTGGQTRNPYGAFDTWGSSSGSAVAVASDLVTVSIGTETQGSIIMPAGINGIVGLKPSMGLISGKGIVPLMLFQDVAGPMGRTVGDVATVLTALTANAPNAINYEQYLNNPKAGLAVGLPVYTTVVIDSLMKRFQALDSTTKANIKLNFEKQQQEAVVLKRLLETAGLKVVEIAITELPSSLNVSPLLHHGFKRDINAFLKSLGKEAPHASLEAIIAWNRADSINRAPYGMKYLINSQNNPMSDAAYDSATASHQLKARTAIDKLLKKYNVDVLASQLAQVYAPAGYPALAVPSGYDAKGQPQWQVFTAGMNGEAVLLAVGHKYEMAAKPRKDPDLDATIEVLKKLPASK